MTTLSKDEILRLAREAGATPYTNRHYPENPHNTFGLEQLERFAHLCRADLVAELETLRYEVDAIAGVKQERDELVKTGNEWYESYNNKRIECDALRQAWEGSKKIIKMIEAERDALKATLEKLRESVHLPDPDIETEDGWEYSEQAILAYGDARALAASEQYRADALRYRWLRDSDSEHARVMTYIDGLDEWLGYATAEDIDAAVDMKRGES